MALLPPVVRVCGDTPVAAAGGMMSAKSVTAAMTLGACAAVLGSYLLKADESAWPRALKDQVAWSDDASTRLSDLGTGRLTRMVKTGIIEALEGAQLSASVYPGQLKVLAPIFEAAITQNRADLLEMALGQAAQTAPAGSTCAIVAKLIDELKSCWR